MEIVEVKDAVGLDDVPANIGKIYALGCPIEQDIDSVPKQRPMFWG